MLSENRQKLTDIIIQMKQEVAASINEVRVKNPCVTVISDNPHIFTVKASQLNDSWSPITCDFDAQFDYVLEKLDKQSIDTFYNTLTKLVQTHTIDGIRFHPAVIDRLAQIL